jgi:hypothetical protein
VVQVEEEIQIITTSANLPLPTITEMEEEAIEDKIEDFVEPK